MPAKGIATGPSLHAKYHTAPEYRPGSLRRAAIILVMKMYADSSSLDYPQCTRRRMLFCGGQEIAQASLQSLQRGLRSRVQNDDAGTSIRREAQYLGEVTVERD